MEVLTIILLITLLGVVIFFNTRKNAVKNLSELNIEEDKLKITDLEKKLAGKEVELNTLKQNLEIANTQLSSFHQIKLEKAQIQERLKLIEWERNNLKNENTRLVKDEETRNETLRKSVASSNTLQASLEKERQRIVDDRLKEIEENFEIQKQTWREHEKDVENHIQLICQNHVIKYVSQEEFPHPRNKPDNAIEIMDQLIIFDAKSPANDDLNNFSKYIKLQTEN